MQLADIGRNDPCPCGSGHKYKKCCLGARADALAGRATDINVGALVDDAIATDDWSAIHDLVDQAMEVFELGGPLEHVRFRDDLIDLRENDAAELEKLCPPGWNGRCELDIAHVLARFELEPDVRDGLRMAAHLVRRFGAASPIVEELASLQIDERIARRRRLANALSARGLGLPHVKTAWADIASWIERARPDVLSFADWFALRATPDEMLEVLWTSGLASRVCDACLDRLDDVALEDAPSWAVLASLTLLGGLAPISQFLAQQTPLHAATADEQAVYARLQHQRRAEGLDGVMHRIVRATEARGDFAGGALLRETMRRVQSWKRDDR